ncbi:two-component system, OmpR family, sensor histidine kinase VicK [Paenibacillus sp. UNCCL117]|uniref:cell wall metabolism sensor histidine kinase WalK n=1 Tax=unclassified Paenibacillus TaxID=185978 RepID=UPI0008911117|nr:MULTISPECIES: cell wall metabolism sensor histidine kinase WalK [unclassified Paenibacillus]SDD85876.1 two-component system, OmpR family, sensor histidine kinase VicK [Paenibacillus sp. cl123]SFW54280.1 two-component system, OmpR family, sensor histidine kinase VicK [Paenibacillus sp. UNCCL117]
MKRIRFFQSIQAKLIIIYLLMIMIAMQLIAVYFTQTLEASLKKDYIDNMNSQAMLLAQYAETYLNENQSQEAAKGGGGEREPKRSYADLNQVVNSLFASVQAEIQVIDANGLVVTTSLESNKSVIGSKNTQTEVTRALQGIKENQRTFTDTSGVRKLVIAKPIGSGTKYIGAVYMVSSMEEVYNTMNRINRFFITGTLIALAMTAVLGVMLSATITNPIKALTKQAGAVAEGRFDEKVRIMGQDELGQLGQTFNFMMERLHEALTLNEEEKERLASILANMNDGLIASDDNGRVMVINRRAKQLLKVNEDTTLGMPLAELLGITPDIVRQLEASEDHTALLQFFHEEEDPLFIRVTYTAIQSKGRGAAGTIAVLQDVTGQEKLEQSRREFVANVSHELRTPLTTIKSYLEALEDGALEDPQLAGKFVGVAHNETERMIRLVNDLLQLSRLDSRRVTIAKEKTDVTEMLEEVADRFSFQLEQRSIAINVDVEPGVRSILLDRDRIDQVLDNLVSNAIKYTPEGGHISIHASCPDAGRLEVSVKDDGIGIPRKDLSRIFERFYRVDKARSRSMGGTGLGLSIAREIVKAHGGTIQLDSEYGLGTKVTFTLPYHQEEAVL